jgi:hypothetical protein
MKGVYGLVLVVVIIEPTLFIVSGLIVPFVIPVNGIIIEILGDRLVRGHLFTQHSLLAFRR